MSANNGTQHLGDANCSLRPTVTLGGRQLAALCGERQSSNGQHRDGKRRVVCFFRFFNDIHHRQAKTVLAQDGRRRTGFAPN